MAEINPENEIPSRADIGAQQLSNFRCFPPDLEEVDQTVNGGGGRWDPPPPFIMAQQVSAAASWGWGIRETWSRTIALTHLERGQCGRGVFF